MRADRQEDSGCCGSDLEKQRDRKAIIDSFTAGEIPVLVNCMVFTEGTDIPRVEETVIIARPTQSDSLYSPDGRAVGCGYPRERKAHSD